MASRRQRGRWGITIPAVAIVALVLASLLAGVVYAAHRDRAYRRSVDASFSAEAGALLAASNATGQSLAATISHPGAHGRTALAAQLGQLTEASAAQAQAAAQLQTPPPDAGAATVLIDTLRLRARAIATIASAFDRLLGLAAGRPVGSARPVVEPGHPIGIPGAKGLLRRAGRELVLADETYAKLPARFAHASGGAVLPASRWTNAAGGVLTPPVLLASAPLVAHNPRLQATVRLVITAIETTPLELPLGAGYPITPTRTFEVAVSVRNVGTASSPVTAIISVQPLGLVGRPASGRASGVVSGQGAVALVLPTMPVVPGEHCLVIVELVRPARQTTRTGLRWRRTVVVAQS
jgi:hypothetical protein